MELLKERAYHIAVDGDICEISPVNEITFDLGEVQGWVEGYIEIIYLSEEQIMIINEDGKFSKKYNPIATGIAQLHDAIAPSDYVCGNVVICPSPMLP